AWRASLRQNQGESKQSHPYYPKPPFLSRALIAVYGLTKRTSRLEKVRQSSSHMILVREGHQATLSVPDHKEMAAGTLRTLIRSAGLTVDEFAEAAR
ncbi:MAG: type II toxin-antitoxin system HicA family toxin, partial [Pirellulales bacterium]